MNSDRCASESEPVDAFSARLTSWLAKNMPPARPQSRHRRGTLTDEEVLADVARNRELQRRLFDAGFAGITVPTEYGGLGLTTRHADVFREAIVGYEYPYRLQVPTFSPCMALLLEFGTEEQKGRHVPAILRGDEIWMQFLSEPGGGSDVAAARTTARRDGDEWALSGSKIWTTGAWWSDWALCLARTNWDVPKHRGLTVFMLPIRQPAIEIHRIEMLDGSKEFCQEFLDGVRVPDTDRLGDIDRGWDVGLRWMTLEKSFYSSPYVVPPRSTWGEDPQHEPLVALARRCGRLDDVVARDMIGEARTLELARREVLRRVPEAIALGRETEHAVAIVRLMAGVTATRRATLSFALAAGAAAAWDEGRDDLDDVVHDFLHRQSPQISGGTTEMARNVISERVLGMPRERAADRGLPFGQVPHGSSRGPVA